MIHKTIQLYKESISGLKLEVWYLSLVLLINRAGAMVIPFLTIYLTSQRGFTPAEAGWIMSTFGVGSLFGSYIGGWITDRFGFYPVQQWALVGSGIAFYILGQQTTFWGMCAGIFVLSLVTDAFRPANQAALAFYSNPENRARAYGLLRLAVNLGFSIGPVMGGLLIAGLGYEWLFIVNGASCLAAAFAFRLLLPPGKSPKEAKPERKSLTGTSAYRNPMFIAFIFFNMLGATAFMQFFSSLPVYLKDHLCYTESQIALLIAINGLLIVCTELPLVHWTGQRYRSLKVISFGYLLLAASYIVLQEAATGHVFAVGFILLLTISEMLSMPFASTYSAGVAPTSRRGEYMGLLSIGWAVAFIAAPSIGLQTAERFGFTTLWWVAGGLAAISATGIAVVFRLSRSFADRREAVRISQFRTREKEQQGIVEGKVGIPT